MCNIDNVFEDMELIECYVYYDGPLEGIFKFRDNHLYYGYISNYLELSKLDYVESWTFVRVDENLISKYEEGAHPGPIGDNIFMKQGGNTPVFISVCMYHRDLSKNNICTVSDSAVKIKLKDTLDQID